MKTITTAAVLMMLTATAWADEPQDQKQAATNEPIVLSEAEMDGVTAGGREIAFVFDGRDKDVSSGRGDAFINDVWLWTSPETSR